MRRIRRSRDEVSVVRADSASTTGRPTIALEQLFDDNYDRIYRFCYVRTGSASAAEDIAAETFVDAARASDREDAEVDTAWLFMVAKRRIVDHWRRSDAQRRRIQRLRSMHGPEAPVLDPTGDNAATELVAVALDRLPDRQRAALILRYVDEHSVEEVAEWLGTSYRAAESMLARARRGFVAAWSELT